jgi:hypothetical protein
MDKRIYRMSKKLKIQRSKFMYLLLCNLQNIK